MNDQPRYPGVLKAAREGAGLSQAKLAGMIGVTRQTLANWEGGIRWIHASKMEQLAAILDVEVKDLCR